MMRVRVIVILLAALSTGRTSAEVFDEAAIRFAGQLNLAPIERTGIQTGGRVTIVDTFAREQVSSLYGQASIDGSSPAFSYLELYFNAAAYWGKPIVKLPDDMLPRMMGSTIPPEARKTLAEKKRIAPRYVLPDAERAAFPGAGAFRIVPPADGSDRWFSPYELEDLPAGMLAPRAGGPQARQALVTLRSLGDAWRARDADAANRLIEQLADELREAGPQAQPSRAKALAEHTYNRFYHFTPVWVGFALAFVLMFLAVVFRGKLARRAGLAVFTLSTLCLAAGFAIRWWISGRAWYLPPLMGQFESVVAAALLASVLSLVLHGVTRKPYFVFGASFFAMVSLLCGFLLPQAMRPGIAPPAAIQNNWILPLHVGVIILGYGFIGISLVISLAYLVSLCRPGARRPGLSRSSGNDLRIAGEGKGVLFELDRCNLIVVQLACVFVGAGTILGAYWGDYSWGRWWGWDAKEVWALITWVIYLGIVHVRLISSARTRGVWTSVLSLAGAAVMLFNWLGVKYLSVLHGGYS